VGFVTRLEHAALCNLRGADIIERRRDPSIEEGARLHYTRHSTPEITFGQGRFLGWARPISHGAFAQYHADISQSRDAVGITVLRTSRFPTAYPIPRAPFVDNLDGRSTLNGEPLTGPSSFGSGLATRQPLPRWCAERVRT